MEKFSVLLETLEKLPHLELGEEVAEITGAHIQNVYINLRRQQGIVWEHLEREKANALGALLIERGFSAGLVHDEDVRQMGNAREIHCGAVVEDGLLIEDQYGGTDMMGSDSIELAQTGWIEEKEEDASDRYKPRRVRLGIDPYAPGISRFLRPGVQPTGWVLQVYPVKEADEFVRIFGKEFNYGYQGDVTGNRKQRFGMLLTDLSDVLSVDKLDLGFRVSMGATESPTAEARYETLDEMTERARWLLTMKKLMRG